MSDQESIMARFFSKANEFMDVFNRLNASADAVKGTPYEKQVNDMLARGESTRSKIDNIKTSIDNAVNFANTTWGNVTDWAKDLVGLNGTSQLGELGAIPLLIPAAVISAVTSATVVLTNWISDATALQAKIDQYNDLKEKGYSDQDAVKITNQLLRSRANAGFMDKAILLVALGLGGWWLIKNKG